MFTESRGQGKPAAEALGQQQVVLSQHSEATAAALVWCKQGHGLLARLPGREKLKEADLHVRIGVHAPAAGLRIRYINLLVGFKPKVMLIQIQVVY